MSNTNYLTPNIQASSSILNGTCPLILSGMVSSFIIDSTEPQKKKNDEWTSEMHIKGEPEDINEGESFISNMQPNASERTWLRAPHYPHSPVNQDSDTKILEAGFNHPGYPFNSCQDNLQSPFRISTQQQHVSPFIPFCRDHLSPLCPIDSNISSWKSKRVLFSPK
jgi:hypothetical protein